MWLHRPLVFAGDDVKDDSKLSELPTVSSDLFERSANERRILALLQKNGALPSVDIAKRLDLSAQSVSVMTRTLEASGLLRRDPPIRGKVGKPQTPFRLNGAGAYSIGLRIGRRSIDIALCDFNGSVRGHKRTRYPFPTPETVECLAKEQIALLLDDLPRESRHRIAGIGIGAPFELWNWLDDTSAPKAEMMAWRAYNIATAFAEWTDLDVIIGNDASLACQGEAMFGAARGLSDFGYFYLGSFIGGGVFLNGQLFSGSNGNAGAFASFPMRDHQGNWSQLLSHASIAQLERAVDISRGEAGHAVLSHNEWRGIDKELRSWIDETATHLAYASLTVVAAFDVPKIVIDGSFPDWVRETLTQALRHKLQMADHRGIRLPEIVDGVLGGKAGALGAAYEPIISRLL